MQLIKLRLRKTKKVLPEEQYASKNALVSMVQNTQRALSSQSSSLAPFYTSQIWYPNVHSDKY